MFSQQSRAPDSPIEAEVLIKRRGNLFLFLHTKHSLLDLDPNDGVENPVLTERTRCNAVNNNYSFSLRRLGSQSSWVISQYGAPGTDAFASVQRQLQMTTPGAALFGATAFCDGASMLVISARKDFRVQSIQMKELEGRKLALLEFTLAEKKWIISLI